MTNYQSDQVFNLILNLAVVVCLTTLALGLVVGNAPLTVLIRSSAAFTVFALLAWAVSLVWVAPPANTAAQQPQDGEADNPAQPAADDDGVSYHPAVENQ